MLKNLFISKVRIKILKQYLVYPNEGHHVRALVRMLDEEINAVRRELQNLEACKILQSKRMNNKLVYSINPSCPILNELKSLIFKDLDISQKIFEIIEHVGNTESIIITESLMKNTYDSDLDVDLLFIGELNVNKLNAEMKRLEKELGKELRYSVLTMKDFDFAKKKREPFLLNIIQKDYVILYGSSSIMSI